MVDQLRKGKAENIGLALNIKITCSPSLGHKCKKDKNTNGKTNIAKVSKTI